MQDEPRGISWEAPEHTHFEKSKDWFWVLGIIALALTVVFILFDNILLAIVICIGAYFIGISANRKPRVVPFAVTTRGVRVDDTLFPYATLESYCIDGDDLRGPHLFLKSERLFMPLIVIPLPDEYLEDIESILESKLQEERLEEPFAHKLLEFFGF